MKRGDAGVTALGPGPGEGSPAPASLRTRGTHSRTAFSARRRSGPIKYLAGDPPGGGRLRGAAIRGPTGRTGIPLRASLVCADRGDGATGESPRCAPRWPFRSCSCEEAIVGPPSSPAVNTLRSGVCSGCFELDASQCTARGNPGLRSAMESRTSATSQRDSGPSDGSRPSILAARHHPMISPVRVWTSFTLQTTRAQSG